MRLMDFVYHSTLGLRVIKKKDLGVDEEQRLLGVVVLFSEHLQDTD